MNRKDSLAILGMLLADCNSMVFYEGQQIKTESSVPSLIEAIQVEPNLIYAILEYINNLKLSYKFIKDILNDNYGSVFYHFEWGYNSEPLPKKYNKKDLCSSDHDRQIWVTDEGRIGVWCEVDGFVAWLDEYETVWIVDTREEVAEQERKHKEWFDKVVKPVINNAFEKYFNDEVKKWYESDPNELINFYTTDGGKVKIAKIETEGLSQYGRGNK